MDLIGFWFNATIMTVLLLSPLLHIATVLIRHFVHKITGDEELAGDTARRVLCQEGNWRQGRHTVILGRVTLPVNTGVFLFFVWAGSILAWFGSAVLCDEALLTYSVVYAVSTVASTLAPYTGGIAVAIAVYVASIAIGRKVYSISTKVNKLMEKANDSDM